MQIQCPNCQHLLTLHDVKAGRFTPRCIRCKEKFLLVIPEVGDTTPRARAIPRAGGAATLPPAATMAPAAASATTVPNAPAANAAAASSATPAMTAPPSAGLGATTPPPRAAAAPASGVARRPPSQAVRPPGDADEEPPVPLTADNTVPPPPPEPLGPDEPSSLGGYSVVRKLGQGGMGAVYLARQLSLDRPVALKVLAPRLAEDAGFVSRFTREAYAAAQLTHHNVVQVYDIGEDRGRHFYSMEFVEGDSLAGVVARDGRIDPDTAVAYTLQAARGLKFAHDRGLIHRDVKPDNLMLSTEGVVKVADLGLVKKFGQSEIAHRATYVGDGKLAAAQRADVTGVNLSMGTPAYMAPEQARDAARVDARADIYSLGCTLYDLLVGRPPFSGKTAVEVMTKHASEPITPPDVVSKRVPKEVSGILMRMVAKRPDDRFPNAAACIAALEDYLGTASGGVFTLRETHAAEIEEAATAFRNTPLARAGRYAVPAYFGALGLAVVFAALLGDTLGSRIVWAGGFLGLGVLTAVMYVVVAGVTRRDPTFGKLRPLLFGARVAEWLRAVLVIALAGLVLWVFGLLWAIATVAFVALAVAAGYHFGLQWPRESQRRLQVDHVLSMMRTMRLRGLDEDQLRFFVCRHAGRHWEEFYEALFGYDAKIDARRRWNLGVRGRPRPKFGLWRDALIAWAAGRSAARQAARERRLLAKTEEARLEAEGVDLLTARKKARLEAAQLVHKAAVERHKAAAVREVAARSAVTSGPGPAPAVIPAPPPRPLHIGLDGMPIEREHESAFVRKGGLPALVFGPAVRFPVAAVLLCVFCLWFHQVNPQFPNNFGRDARAAIDNSLADLSAARPPVVPGKAAAAAPAPIAPLAPGAPVRTPAVPDLRFTALPYAVRHQLSGYGVGVAGVLLLVSCLARNWRCGALALLATAVMLLGGLVVPPAAGQTPATLADAAGVGLFALAFAFGRS